MIRVIVILLLLIADVALGDYKEHYKEGMKAYDLKKWSEVIRRMESAIAEKSKEGEQVLLYGMRSEPYLPHFYLGVARQKTGDCTGAVSAFRESDRQGAVRRTRMYRELQSLRLQCGGDEEPAAPVGPDPGFLRVVSDAEKILTEAEFAVRTATGLKTNSDLADLWKSDGTIRSREAALVRALDDAKRELEGARSQKSAEAARRAGERGAELRSEAETFRRDVLARKQEIAEQQKRSRELARRRPDGESPLRKPQPTPEAPKLVPSGPPVELVSAVRSYFAGDYAIAERSLTNIAFTDPIARSQAFLIRGASRHALFLLGGESNAALRDQALNDLRESRRIDRTFRLDPKFFSPRFASFFYSVKP